ncbi:hypothetical protein MTR67_024304 [Solanum verrucosum]|uniref:WRKY domain-containing protein n=1 Tax=Solanum verrucosum TaxID=315347 RepID=A0AAF0R3J6_SOLVR|nr:probable WRKY transcription factor 41 [Solanum verrucosum]WMV30919.1 hypothetical protein MTR67_024304 [Solanum verrucosum]
MGENNCWVRQVVITELTKGKEFLLQLQKHVEHMKQDVCLQYLATEVLSSYDKVLSLLNGSALSSMINIKAAPSAAPQLESPQFPADNSAKSCDRPSISRKRKIVSRRREYVHARSGEEVPPEDGYSWRKYGQKNILGAKYPREYYRCARNRSSNCAATKMVQRSETEESLAFEVSYGENHSCGQEKKNQNEELVAVQQTKCDHEIEIGAGEISEFDILEMVSTPNNLFDSDFISTPASSPLPDTNYPHNDDSLTDPLFNHDVPDKSSVDDFISPYAQWDSHDAAVPYKLSFPHSYNKQE